MITAPLVNPKPGSKPDLEGKMLRIMTEAGLPAPQQQHKFGRYKFDFCWPDLMVACEVMGGTWIGKGHVGGAIYARDCKKANLAAIAGWCVIRVTTDMLRNGEALEHVTAALRQKGWAG